MEARHDGSHGSHGAGSTASTTPGVPSYFEMQQMYWAVVGAVIAMAAVCNLLNNIVAIQRFSDTSPTPSKPKSLIFNTYATITAMTREFSYASIIPISFGRVKLHPPPLGRLCLVLANLVALMVFCFYKLDTMDEWSWETVGYRTGFITISQLPLIFLLAGKNNIIGLLTGSSYERLNWLHRWTARTLWLTATIHMGFWFRSWGRYDYIIVKLTTDPLTQRGFASWCILTFIVLASLAPVRRWNYELFVISHLVTFSGFIAAVWLHVPEEVKIWVWIPIGLLVFDRTVRWLAMAYGNLSIFHPRSQKDDGAGNFWANQATFTPLPGNVTKITIEKPAISWKAGQHTFVSCPSILPLQSHPFSIASIPSDGRLEFIVRAERGGTRKIFNHASKGYSILDETADSSPCISKSVAIDGPYGRIRPLKQFDSVVFFAGGMGATYTMPLMRDIMEGWKNTSANNSQSSTKNRTRLYSNIALTKHIRFVWVLRARSHISWFTNQLQTLMKDIDDCRETGPKFNKTIEISIYITCDEELSSKSSPPAAPNLQQQSLSSPLAFNEKPKDSETPMSPSNNSTNMASSCCLPGGGCCCTSKITDENVPSAPCTCSPSSHNQITPTTTSPSVSQQGIFSSIEKEAQSTPAIRPKSSSSDFDTPTSPKSADSLDSRIRLLSGRPDTPNIIRTVLEKAQGESGVVVCGPPGLNADVRQSVVSLSDERAVHKGTGAQGIYLHVEQFGF